MPEECDSHNDKSALPPASSEASTPKLILVATLPREPTPAQKIENTFWNPWGGVRLSMMARASGSGPEGSDVAFPDRTLVDLRDMLHGAWLYLDQLAKDLLAKSHGQTAFEQRTRARVIIRELNDWLFRAVAERSTQEPQAGAEIPLLIPIAIRNLLIELAKIGRHLALVWVDIEAATAQESRKRGRPTEGDLEEDRQLTVRWDAGEFRSRADMAKVVNKSKELLKKIIDRQHRREMAKAQKRGT